MPTEHHEHAQGEAGRFAAFFEGIGITDLVQVGRGGFSVVYRGLQRELQRLVAVKILNAPGMDEDAKRRFERELRALGALSGHPGIVTVHDGGITDDGYPYLIMRFVEGGSLASHLTAYGPFDPPTTLRHGVKLAGALAGAHMLEILHRDIKPANVLLTPYGPALADFGIARLEGAGESRSGVVTGSLAHAAPEVLDGRRADAASDVYALSSTLFAMLTGVPPFWRETDESIQPMIVRILTEAVPNLRDAGIPDALCQVIEFGMAKDPAQRCPDAITLGEALQDVERALGLTLTELLTAAPSSGPVEPRFLTDRPSATALPPAGVPADPTHARPRLAPPAPRPPDPEPEPPALAVRRLRWPAVAAAMGLVLVLTGVGLAASRNSGPQPAPSTPTTPATAVPAVTTSPTPTPATHVATTPPAPPPPPPTAAVRRVRRSAGKPRARTTSRPVPAMRPATPPPTTLAPAPAPPPPSPNPRPRPTATRQAPTQGPGCQDCASPPPGPGCQDCDSSMRSHSGSLTVPAGASAPTAGAMRPAQSSRTTRVDATSPIDIAIAISKKRFGNGVASWAVLARHDLFADALAGAPLTAAGPLLLTSSRRLSSTVEAEIDRVLPPKTGTRRYRYVYILGGYPAVSEAVENRLEQLGYTVLRLNGPSRVETAVAIAREVRNSLYRNAPKDAVLARADAPASNPTAAWADAVTGGAWATALHVPVLVTQSTSLHPAVRQALTEFDPDRVILMGGESALSREVRRAVRPWGPQRVSGVGRAETAAAVLPLWRENSTSVTTFTIVNGFQSNGWAFGLAAAGYAADRTAPVLLTDTDTVPDATLTGIDAACPRTLSAAIVGADAIISEKAEDTIRGTLECR